MNKILIVSYRFPPHNSMGSRRWAEMIPKLKEKYDVYVFAMNSEGDLEVDLPESNIMKVGQLSNEMFDKDYNVSLFHKIISLFIHEMRSIDSTWLSWYNKNKTKFLEYYDTVNPDIVVTTVGPYSSALFAKYLIKKGRKFKWVLDIRDAASQFAEYTRNKFQQYFDEILDKYLCKEADLITSAVGDYSIKQLTEFYKKTVHQILNGFPKFKYNDYKQNNTKKVIYYAGRIYEYQEKSFFLLLNYLQNRDDYLLKIRLLGTQKRRKYFIDYIKSNSIKNVQILNPAEAKVISKESAKADILLILETIKLNSKSSLGVYTGKLFEYLPYQAPILAICNKRICISDVLHSTNRGMVIEKENQLNDFFANIDSYKLQNEKQIEQYSRDYQASSFIKLLEREFEF